MTVLCENTVRGAGLLGEHGLAWWVDTGTYRVLFDTGQGQALEHNARKLNIPLEKADAIVLSHGHYDHVGGLPRALEIAPNAELWLHPEARKPKFSKMPNGRPKRISTAFMEHGDFGAARNVREISAPCEVVPGVWVTGEIPRRNNFEDVGGPFFLDEALTQPDPLLDDMALYCPTSGTVIFGCAHAGAINTLTWIEEALPKAPIRSLVGGLHLLVASEKRIERTIEALQVRNPECLAFGHCTGFAAVHRLLATFPSQSSELYAGRVWDWS